MSKTLKKNSLPLTEGPDRAPARAMLRAVGLTDDDFTRPLIAIANTWSENTPCNYHLRDLAAGDQALQRRGAHGVAHGGIGHLLVRHRGISQPGPIVLPGPRLPAPP